MYIYRQKRPPFDRRCGRIIAGAFRPSEVGLHVDPDDAAVHQRARKRRGGGQVYIYKLYALQYDNIYL